MTQPVMTQSVNNQPVLPHSCEYCGDGTPQQSRVWRKIVCCDDGTRQEVWCCDECYDDPSIEVLQIVVPNIQHYQQNTSPNGVLTLTPNVEEEEEEEEEIIDLCDE